MPKKRTSMSLDGGTHKRGEERAKELGYDSFSSYIEALIAADSDGRYSHYMVREGGVIRYGLTVTPEDDALAQEGAKAALDRAQKDNDGTAPPDTPQPRPSK